MAPARKSRKPKSAVRSVEKTELLDPLPPSHEAAPPMTSTEEPEGEHFIGIYLVIVLAFVSLILYVYQTKEPTTSQVPPLQFSPSDARTLASTQQFGCHSSERMDSEGNAQYVQTYLKDHCDLSKPFSASSARFGDYKTPKSLICCWKK